jgi:hypothetical protein
LQEFLLALPGYVAVRKRGGRCRAPALHGRLLCVMHDGRCEPAAGGRAKAAKLRRIRAEAEERSVLMKMGVRGAVAAVLSEKAEQVTIVVWLLLEDATDETRSHGERVKSAQALLPWIDQALGRPVERVEPKVPTSVDDLSKLSNEELAALVAEGRRRRLAAAAKNESA